MPQNSEEDDHSRQLPTCRRCRVRKIKCDRGAPKCSNCTKAKAACIIVDPVTLEQYPRDYIRRLEERERELRLKLEDASPVLIHESATETTITAENDTPATQPSVSTLNPNGYVGDGSGLGFLRHVLSDPKWHHYKPQILQHLSERPNIPELSISANVQPPVEEATALLDN
ncbi:hypothetical protein B0I35DRAFT_114047 [Stachybotrys elegans]|uniref:Zn(2)-C6 fungal-type domain-containing protein n=1 Tax=Stachybotrys elegans TaxID=80388 RepID=A0A8K0SFQ0_9HYPO|nr:hypothetical protein B0I35DRAFT_114047 [Stachybotrys elegans]